MFGDAQECRGLPVYFPPFFGLLLRLLRSLRILSSCAPFSLDVISCADVKRTAMLWRKSVCDCLRVQSVQCMTFSLPVH